MNSPILLESNATARAPWSLLICNCGPLQTNAYLLRQGQEAVIIDPAIGAEPLLDQMRAWQKAGINLTAIWNTHGHLDHVYDNARWKAEFGVPILCHQADHFFLEHLREQALWFGLPAPEVAPPDADLQGGQRLRVGELSVDVLELPGHSPGSVAFRFDDVLISGDVIFRDSYGRTDLPGARAADLAASLRQVLAMAPATRILPGHGDATTVEIETVNNAAARALMAQFAE